MSQAAGPVDSRGATQTPVGPHLPSILATRPRLLTRLGSNPAPLTIVRAPLGFGKTTVIAQHLRAEAREDNTALAWLRLSVDTATAESFWAALLDTLQASGMASGPARVESMRARIHRTLTRAAHPVTLVLDDVDQLTAEGPDHELLMILRDSPLLRLVVCLRGHRHFRPAQHLDIDTITLTADDLRFTLEETEQLLGLCEVGSPARRAIAVYEETGGWPELTRACALALSPHSSPSAGAIGLSGREVATAVAAACLHDRVQAAIGDTEILDFALATSVVEAVPSELAALLDPDHRDTVAAWLRRLTADGLLTVAAQGQHDVYRWPPAVRQALHRETQRRDPGRIPVLHRIAAEWFLENDQPESALRQATAAGDWPSVVRVIEAKWEELVLTARPALIAAFGETPDEIVESSLLCRLVRSLAMSTNDHALFDNLPTLPNDSAQLDQLGREPDVLSRMRLANAIMVTLRTRGHHARASEHGARLTVLAESASLAHPVEIAPRLPGLLLQVGLAHLWAGDFTPAHRILRRAYDLAPHGSTPHIARGSAGRLALLLAMQGDTDRCAVWLERHDAAPRTQGWLENQVGTGGLLARAWSALDRLDLPAAAHALGGIDSDVVGSYETSAVIGYVQALYRLHTGRVEEGLHELSRVIATYRAVREPGSLPVALLDSLKADLLLALGRANHARAIMRTMPDHPLMRIPHARMLLLSGDPRGALGVANDLGWLHAATPRLTVEMLVIKAVAHHRNGQPETATATLGNAINAGVANQLRRPFATVVHNELLDIAADLSPEARDFLHHPALTTASPPFADRVDLVHLTDRERLILTRLAQGQRVRDIAADLFLSYNTVRTYLRQIYKKLDANSRERAIAQARAFGLIAS